MDGWLDRCHSRSLSTSAQACADPSAVRSAVMADSPLSYAVGVVAVALDSLLSGFATVYFEKAHTCTCTCARACIQDGNQP